MSAPESIDLSAACLYRGRVRHRRFTPKPHDFSYGLYMAYVELGRMEEILDRVTLASAKRPALVRYRRKDYFGDPGITLDACVRDLVESRSGVRPEGPVRMLTHLRTWGVSFNPVTFFYCFDTAGETVEHFVAEINNTPWDERYTYVLSQPEEERDLTARPEGARRRPKRVVTFRTGKLFHVSPFIDMDMQYLWKFSEPGESLLVHMEDHPLADSGEIRGDKVFDATLSLDERIPFDTKHLLWNQVRHPAMPAMVLFGIYRQALALWLKKVPFYTHPRKRAGSAHS